MTRAHYRNAYQGLDASNRLQVVAGATVNLYQPGTATPVTWPIYSAASGGATQPNPLTADARGTIEFWTDTNQRFDALVTPVVSSGVAAGTVTGDAVSPDTLASLVITTGGLTVTGGVVSANALTVQSGGASITGGVTIPSGGLNVQGGGITVTGGETVATGRIVVSGDGTGAQFAAEYQPGDGLLSFGASHSATPDFVFFRNDGAETFRITNAKALKLAAQPALVAGDKYLVVDASGNVHVSALGPAS